jgi:hypothetical protein
MGFMRETEENRDRDRLVHNSWSDKKEFKLKNALVQSVHDILQKEIISYSLVFIAFNPQPNLCLLHSQLK